MIFLEAEMWWPLKGPFGVKGRRGLCLLLGLLGEKNCLNVGQHSSLGDGDSGKELVQFLVVSDGQLQMSGDDSGLLVISGGITCQFENFSSQVLQDSGEVDWSSSSNSFSVVSFSEESMDTSNRELKSCSG